MKKRSGVIFFMAAIAAIAVIMMVANRRSLLERELRFPFNNGIARLSTYGNRLVAVCHGQKIYVWDWGNPSGKPQLGSAPYSQAAVVKSDLVVSVELNDPEAIILSGLTDDKKRKEIPVDSGVDRCYLGVNRDSSTVVILLTEDRDKSQGGVRHRLLLVDWDTGLTHSVIEITTEEVTSKLIHPVVSDHGLFVILLGEKDGVGWMVLVSTEDRQVVWEKQMPEFRKFCHAAFSPDNKVIYARGSDSTLYKIDTASGKILERLLPSKSNKSTFGHSSVQAVAVSPDGKLVAAIIFQTVFVWECETRRQVFKLEPQHKIESGLVFSPDSRFLATSDARQGGTIKIWRIPGQ